MTTPTLTPEGRRAFLLEHTHLRPAPHVPEVQLHQADDMTLLWQHSEAALGRPGVEPPYWASAWAGGQAVARYVLDHPELVAGRSVLDVATGSGLCAIAAALAGGGPVTATDVDDFSVTAVAENAEANGVAVRAVVDDVFGHGPALEDVVLAGDVCYERGMAERALAWMRRCRERGALVLLGDPGRAFLPSRGLVEVARYPITGDPVLENEGVRHASVFTV